MHLAILSQYYPPEIGAPQRRLSELAERMVKAGYQVSVLTAMPNYPRGRIYDGYGGLLKREVVNGVNVCRTLIYPTQKTSFIHRLTNYFSFVISSAFIGMLFLREVDYLLVESPPLFLGLSGIWLSWIKRARLIFNVSDLWPESAVQLGLVRENSRVHRISAWLERQCYQRAWLITGQSKGILRSIQTRFPQKPTFRLSNGVDVARFGSQYSDDAVARKLKPSGGCVAIYAGLHGLAQGLEQIIHAADQLRHERGLEIYLVGDGPQKKDLIRAAEQRNLPNLHFLDPVPADHIPTLLASADVIIITLKSYITGAVPSKLYEAMASVKPVIMVATGEPADIVEQSRAGITVIPGDVEGLVRALHSLRNSAELRLTLGHNGRRAVEADYDREKIVNSFISYLETKAQ